MIVNFNKNKYGRNEHSAKSLFEELEIDQEQLEAKLLEAHKNDISKYTKAIDSYYEDGAHHASLSNKIRNSGSIKGAKM